MALAAAVAANVTQVVVGRVGIRATLTTGLLAYVAGVALLCRLPVDGQYVSDLFPAFLLGGAGLGLSFVSATIASLSGVGHSDAGVASGLVNTSRQIGGAIGVAASSAAALDHGFQIGFCAIIGVLVVGVLIAATLVTPRSPSVEVEGKRDQQLEALHETA